MLNDLTNRVTAQTGLSHEQAQSAVNSVLGFLKEKLPAPIVEMAIDPILTGSVSPEKQLDSSASSVAERLPGWKK